MLSFAGAVSHLRQAVHGTRTARHLYRLFGWLDPIRRKTGVERVLFLGDSITQLWAVEDPRFFLSNAFTNSGVGGLTSGQVRARSRTDIIDHDPDAVHLLCGINDIAENTGPVSDRRILKNIERIISFCRAKNISMIVGGLTPVTIVPWNPNIEARVRIETINARLANLCRAHDIPYADYHAILRTSSGTLRDEFTIDGLHLSLQGYRAIEPAMLAALDAVKQAWKPM